MTRARRATPQGPKASRSSTAARRSTVDPYLRAGKFTVNATEAKNQFGEILRRIKTSAPVFIEKHGAPLAVVLDVESYEALRLRARDTQQLQLDALRDEFEALYARMQTPASRHAIDRLFAASADELNSVAARHAKRRG
jgi:prevent-host-death family protein